MTFDNLLAWFDRQIKQLFAKRQENI